tara:strand:- start:209 stop:448 length:240 start_codon:yes stop_codon:yes gene_type:complete
MIETIFIITGSIIGFGFGIYSLVKFSINYSVDTNKETLKELNKMILYRLKNQELKGIVNSEEILTLTVLNKRIDNILLK